MNIDVPPETLRALQALARVNGRTFRGEVLHALRRHLASPPVIVADELEESAEHRKTPA